jgi:WD40 repeat protein
VVLTPDERRAVSALADGTLRVWDLETGKEVNAFRGRTGLVTGIALTPDGHRVDPESQHILGAVTADPERQVDGRRPCS